MGFPKLDSFGCENNYSIGVVVLGELLEVYPRSKVTLDTDRF